MIISCRHPLPDNTRRHPHPRRYPFAFDAGEVLVLPDSLCVVIDALGTRLTCLWYKVATAQVLLHVPSLFGQLRPQVTRSLQQLAQLRTRQRQLHCMLALDSFVVDRYLGYLQMVRRRFWLLLSRQMRSRLRGRVELQSVRFG
jgi:hypothetical protein